MTSLGEFRLDDSSRLNCPQSSHDVAEGALIYHITTKAGRVWLQRGCKRAQSLANKAKRVHEQYDVHISQLPSEPPQH